MNKAQREYLLFPGCSAQNGASASHYLASVETLCAQLGIRLHTIDDWNCCGRDMAYAGGGELPRLALAARNMALGEQQGGHLDIVAISAPCWDALRETKQRLVHDDDLMADTNRALAEAGLKYAAKQQIRHFLEVLISDIGLEEIKKRVVQPLTGKKIATYYGSPADHTLGIPGEPYETPRYLDQLVEVLGAKSVPAFDQQIQCSGGSLSFSEQEKTQALIKNIIEAAQKSGADMIITHCPASQFNLEVHQVQLNAQDSSASNIPVKYYSQLLIQALGKTD